MKWMGWDYQSLWSCPEDLLPTILEAMRDEVEQMRRR